MMIEIILSVVLLLCMPVTYTEMRLACKQLAALLTSTPYYERAGIFWVVLYMRLVYAALWLVALYVLLTMLIAR